jgi:hypothetical protein
MGFLADPCDASDWLEKSLFSRMNRNYLASSIGLLFACAIGAAAAPARARLSPASQYVYMGC